ncbi:MAG: hypothetical protein J2P17_13165, partial [Mycobacterium sp.]|nr:hypothetical protein [Mycobacterium sp.]
MNARSTRTRKGVLVIVAVAALVAAASTSATATASAAAKARGSSSASTSKFSCRSGNFLCTEVSDPESVFGQEYVGHDEPSLLFNSTHPGAGNQMRYRGMLPKEPPPMPIPGKRSYSFMNYIAFWYGMVMCDTQSYPETVHTCKPDSDANITRPGAARHAGAAYMELQFYPPGYVQQFAGSTCSATKWCVALTIDSLSLNPVTGKPLNTACQNRILGGEEYVNFAYLTHNGQPQGPPNPLQFDVVKSGKPDLHKVLTLNQGDRYTVTLHDTAHGLQTTVRDTSTGESGTMTASAANGFGQIKYAPANNGGCKMLPYDFHPMYSTSTPKTTVPWAAATYNVAIDTEIGHFDYCTRATSFGGGCAGQEDGPPFPEPTDEDDVGCFNASASTLVKVTGCEGTNTGFDGTSYDKDWPNGNRNLRPTPTIFTSPTTGSGYRIQYSRLAFNTDLPRIEFETCDRQTGSGCTRIPTTDDGTPAHFYPYYTSGHA